MQDVAEPGEAAVADYDRYRWSPPFDVYARLRELGIKPAAKILDAGIGTGLASAPLAAEGATITGVDSSPAMVAQARARFPQSQIVQGQLEQLPFPDGAFDAAIAGDVLHLVDQQAALGELQRVVRKSGVIAVWWPTLSSEADILGLRAAAARNAGTAAVPEALSGGFRAFYAAPFTDRALRVVPGMHDTTVARWVGYERTRPEVHRALGPQAEPWLRALENAMVATYGSLDAPVRVRLMYYLYAGIV